MAEFFLELFSEEIPARMQAKGAENLKLYVEAALRVIHEQAHPTRIFWGPRRIAIGLHVRSQTVVARTEARGPRLGAPPQAVDGFLKKHNATRADLVDRDGYYEISLATPAQTAESIIREAMPALLRRFTWPKSMRWGGTSGFTWVRPLRRIICLLDGAVVPFDLRDGDDDGHGLVASNLTEGHRFLAPGAFAVSGVADWQAGLRDRHVIVDAAERRKLIAEGVTAVATGAGYSVVDDPGLLDEVAGLVEWPVPLLGRIDAAFMDLPPEVMQVSMRVNQRYFALRTADGKAAPAFAFVANVPGSDGGKAIIAGNERVLSARFTDARHFWDLDRKVSLASRVKALDAITFHAKLGSQGERVARISQLAATIAPLLRADPQQASRAAFLAKADLTSGMVGEFPELQGIIGSYYATDDGEDPSVASAIRDHYSPKGPSDSIPRQPVGCAVAFADKLDTLVGFFGIGEKPSGSGDPYALRRAGLGLIRIIRETYCTVRFRTAINVAAQGYPSLKIDAEEILQFLIERLVVQLRTENQRIDVAKALIGEPPADEFWSITARIIPFTNFLASEDGAAVFNAYTRAANVLADKKGAIEPDSAVVNEQFFRENAECELFATLTTLEERLRNGRDDVAAFESRLLQLRLLTAPIAKFLDDVSVNNPDLDLRRNRRALIARVRDLMLSVADFSKIDG